MKFSIATKIAALMVNNAHVIRRTTSRRGRETDGGDGQSDAWEREGITRRTGSTGQSTEHEGSVSTLMGICHHLVPGETPVCRTEFGLVSRWPRVPLRANQRASGDGVCRREMFRHVSMKRAVIAVVVFWGTRFPREL